MSSPILFLHNRYPERTAEDKTHLHYIMQGVYFAPAF
jgi:hypothetical protein